MPSFKQAATITIFSALGVFVAGVVLNAGRRNDLINFSRNGFDV